MKLIVLRLHAKNRMELLANSKWTKYLTSSFGLLKILVAKRLMFNFYILVIDVLVDF